MADLSQPVYPNLPRESPSGILTALKNPIEFLGWMYAELIARKGSARPAELSAALQEASTSPSKAVADFGSDSFCEKCVTATPLSAVVEFGPRHVVVKTPLSTIRIATFFAGGSKAKIVDPSRISEVQAVGREVDFAPPME